MMEKKQSLAYALEMWSFISKQVYSLLMRQPQTKVGIFMKILLLQKDQILPRFGRRTHFLDPDWLP